MRLEQGLTCLPATAYADATGGVPPLWSRLRRSVPPVVGSGPVPSTIR